MVDWIKIQCYCSNGLTWNGGFDCPECDGIGTLYLSENDRLALYPGGPFRGFQPGLFQKENNKKK